MGQTKILVRLLGEAVDCWRPVDAIQDGDEYEIVGPQSDAEEEWEFQAGEVVRCRSEEGQPVATQLMRSATDKASLARPLSLHGNPVNDRRRNLAEAVGRAIDDADPIGLLANGAPPDEYAPELETILPRLPGANGIEDVTDIVHGEFARWFGVDTAGPREAYETVASKTWQALQAYRYAG